MTKKFVERVLNALMTILCNYAAIAFGIGVFEHSWQGIASGLVSIGCVFVIAAQYED